MLNSNKAAIKRIALLAFFYSGAFHLLRYFRRNKVTILMIHGVVSRDYQGQWSPLWKRLDSEAFEFGLSVIRRYYTVISMSMAADILARKIPPVPHGLVLAFDDGYRNFLTQAYPSLAKQRNPAIVYLATGYMNNEDHYWIDRLDYVLQQVNDPEIDVRIGPHRFRIDGSSRQALALTYADCRRQLKTLYTNDQDLLEDLGHSIQQLEESSGTGIGNLDEDEWSDTLSWEEVARLDRDGIEFGSHSVTHYRLPMIPETRVDDELRKSKQKIEESTGHDCEHFCYPNGNYSSTVCERVRKSGYKTAVSTDRGLNSIGDDLFTLRRIAFPETYCKLSFLWSISSIGDDLQSTLKARRET